MYEFIKNTFIKEYIYNVMMVKHLYGAFRTLSRPIVLAINMGL